MVDPDESSVGAAPRKKKRFLLSLPMVANGINAMGKYYSEETHTLNVSGGGLCFVSEQPLDVGGRLKLSVQLPPKLRSHYGNRAVYRVRAVICRVEKVPAEGISKVGVRFLGDVGE